MGIWVTFLQCVGKTWQERELLLKYWQQQRFHQLLSNVALWSWDITCILAANVCANSFQILMETYCCSYCISCSISSPCLCLSPILFFFLLILISLCQHIPRTQPPSLPFEPVVWMERLSGWRRRGEKNKGKQSNVVGICVSSRNGHHMLISMLHDVADLICFPPPLFLFSFLSLQPSFTLFLIDPILPFNSALFLCLSSTRRQAN